MPNYSTLQLVKDPAAKSLLRQLVDQVSAVSGRLDGGPSWKADVNAGEFRVTNAADAIDDTDLTTLQQVESFLVADVLRRRLEAGGDAELNVSGLAGRLGEPQQMGLVVIPSDQSLPNVNTALPYEVISWQGKLYYFSPLSNPGKWVVLTTAASIIADTHANRLLLYPAADQSTGTLFWETDRTALYYISTAAGVNTWRLIMSRPMSETIANRPADLGTADAGFWFVVIDQGQVTQQWTGTAWVYQQGILNATFASRPTATTTAAGFRFRATDRGYQTWRSTGTVWVLEEGVGGPMRGTIIAADQRPAGLTANDAGFLFEATDAGITFRWSGAAWAVVPAQILAAHITNSVAQTIADSTATTVTFGTTVLDQGGLVSGNTLVVPANCGGTPAVWQFRAEITWDASATGLRGIFIQQNGTTIARTRITPSASGNTQECVAIVFNPAAADVFSVVVVQSSGGNLDVLGSPVAQFKGYRVSANG